MMGNLLSDPGYIVSEAEAQDIIDRCRNKYETSVLARQQVEKYRLASVSALEFAALQMQVVLDGTRREPSRGNPYPARLQDIGAKPGEVNAGLDQIMAVAEAFTLLEAAIAEVRSINNAVALMLLTEGTA